MATITVSPADLTAAFKEAKPGDVLAVTPGTLQKFRPGSPTWDASTNPVVITAADPADPPVFAGGVTMDGWRGVTWRGVTFDIRSAGYAHSAACLAAGTANTAIGFEGNTFIGLSEPTTDANGTLQLGGIGYGIAGKYSGLRIVGNTFRDLPKGIVIADSSDVDILDNDMFDITTDNVQYSGVIGLRIQRNRLYKKTLPDASGAHPDVIQGLKSLLRPSRDVLIADNLGRGQLTGKGTQGVFLSDDPLNDNIIVRGNVMLRTGYRALNASGQRVDIIDNIALSDRPDDYAGLYWTGVSGEVRGNKAFSFNGVPADSVDNVAVGRVTAAEIDAAEAAWMAKFRPTAAPEPYDPPVIIPPPPIPPPGPTVDYLAEANARIEWLLADRAKALVLAKQIEALGLQARKARAKNQYIDQINTLAPQQVTLLSAPQ